MPVLWVAGLHAVECLDKVRVSVCLHALLEWRLLGLPICVVLCRDGVELVVVCLKCLAVGAPCQLLRGDAQPDCLPGPFGDPLLARRVLACWREACGQALPDVIDHEVLVDVHVGLPGWLREGGKVVAEALRFGVVCEVVDAADPPSPVRRVVVSLGVGQAHLEQDRVVIRYLGQRLRHEVDRAGGALQPAARNGNVIVARPVRGHCCAGGCPSGCGPGVDA